MTKCMTIAKEPLVEEDKPIEQVIQFRYLSTYDPAKDLMNRINKASALSRYSLVKPAYAHR